MIEDDQSIDSVATSTSVASAMLMKSRVDSILANATDERLVQTHITSVFTVVGGQTASVAQKRHSNSPPRDEPKRRRCVEQQATNCCQNTSNQTDLCKMCEEEVKWVVCTGYSKPENRGRLFYKCSHCSWFQWQDKM